MFLDVRTVLVLVALSTACGGAVSASDDAGGLVSPSPIVTEASADASADASVTVGEASAPDASTCTRGCVSSADGSVIFWDSCVDAEAVACSELCREGDASACL